MIETLFLDAGGVIVHPNWERVATTLGRHGVPASAEALRRAEPHAKHRIDEDTHIGRTTDPPSRRSPRTTPSTISAWPSQVELPAKSPVPPRTGESHPHTAHPQDTSTGPPTRPIRPEFAWHGFG